MSTQLLRYLNTDIVGAIDDTPVAWVDQVSSNSASYLGTGGKVKASNINASDKAIAINCGYRCTALSRPATTLDITLWAVVSGYLASDGAYQCVFSGDATYRVDTAIKSSPAAGTIAAGYNAFTATDDLTMVVPETVAQLIIATYRTDGTYRFQAGDTVEEGSYSTTANWPTRFGAGSFYSGGNFWAAQLHDWGVVTTTKGTDDLETTHASARAIILPVVEGLNYGGLVAGVPSADFGACEIDCNIGLSI